MLRIFKIKKVGILMHISREIFNNNSHKGKANLSIFIFNAATITERAECASVERIFPKAFNSTFKRELAQIP